jgi:hypothetical protein
MVNLGFLGKKHKEETRQVMSNLRKKLGIRKTKKGVFKNA